MTQVILNNEYQIALQAKRVEMQKKNLSKKNDDLITRMMRALNSERLVNTLKECNVDARRFALNIYDTEKVIKYAMILATDDLKTAEENTYAIFKSAVNCFKNNLELTRQDACASITKDLNVTDDKKNVLFRRNAILSHTTIAAQHTSSLSALETLNIIAKSDMRKDAYKLNINDATKKLCKLFNIELEAKAKSK